MTKPVSAVNTINHHDIYAKYAERDSAGRKITDTYATKQELSAFENIVIEEISAISGGATSGVEYLSAALSGEIERAVSAESELRESINFFNEAAEAGLAALAETITDLSAYTENRIIETSGYFEQKTDEISAAVETLSGVIGNGVIDILDPQGTSFVNESTKIATIPSASPGESGTSGNLGLVSISTIWI